MIYLLLTWLCWPIVRLFSRSPSTVPKRILVIQRAKIGDVICSTPVFRSLRSQFPDAEIDVLAGEAATDILKTNPHLNRIEIWADADLEGWRGKWRLIAMLRKRRYDIVFCLNVGLIYPLACFWSGIPLRYAVRPNFIGTTYRLACGLWTAMATHDGRRLIGETYRLLLQRAGVEHFDVAKEVFPTPKAASKVASFLIGSHSPRIGIGIGAGNRLKALGPEMIRNILSGLFEARPDSIAVLIGTTGDQAVAKDLIAQFPGRTILNACGVFELGEIPVLLQQFDAYLGVDSGITYMADALGIPLVSVAGPCNMQETRPTGPKALVIQKLPPCGPCAHIFRAPYRCATGDLACLRSIRADEVVIALTSLLPRIDSGRKL
ncbi:MAG: glycosyltransferase family 9 protein [Azonexus sp.]